MTDVSRPDLVTQDEPHESTGLIDHRNLLVHAVNWTRGIPVPSVEEFQLYDPLRAGVSSFDAKYILEIERYRTAFIKQFSFAVPCREVLDALQSLEPILEVGAGTGFWTHLMNQRGIDAWSTDVPQMHNEHEQAIGAFGLNEEMDAERAVRTYPSMNVFISWPVYWSDWPERAISAMESDQYLACIDDGRRGQTGSERFYDILDRDFEKLNVLTFGQPSWPRQYDAFHVWRKK